MARSVLILSVFLSGVAKSEELQEGLSLLQTQATLHVQSSGDWDALPDPKQQSVFTAEATGGFYTVLDPTTKDIKDEVDFRCAKGKGKWVLVDGIMFFSTNKNDYVDLSTNATKIVGMETNPGNGQTRVKAITMGTDDRGFTTYSDKQYHQFGPVKNEKDCYNRARLDWKVNHEVETIKYTGPDRQDVRNRYVFYKPSGVTPFANEEMSADPSMSCFFGLAKWLDHGALQRFEIRTKETNSAKAWACRLDAEDIEGITEKTTVDDVFGKEPKEKKTPEERAACKAARSEFKDAKAAVKALRDQLKAARNLLKQKKAAKTEAC